MAHTYILFLIFGQNRENILKNVVINQPSRAT